MKVIDIDKWDRKNHFHFFKQMDYPHFNICANLDITEFHKFIKENENPFFISIMYAATKAANSIKEFRYRIKEDKVVEYEIISPSFTIINSSEVFGFCEGKYVEVFNDFKVNTSKRIEMAKDNVNLDDEPGKDDIIYITSIPWISFNSITHPIHMNPVDCIPRIAWGKYFEENGRIKLPLSVQVHHALVDGVHVGQYFTRLQEILDNAAEHF